MLALLYFGAAVLRPLALALLLALVFAPVVQLAVRNGLSRMAAIIAVLMLVCTCVLGTGFAVMSQLASVGAEMPKYRTAIRHKVEQLRTAVERPVSHVAAGLTVVSPATLDAVDASPPAATEPAAAPAQRLTPGKLSTMLIAPLAEVGVVLVLLVFILLEHETLQDRLIRLTGRADVSRTVRALADAAQGVSRFFLYQFLVNVVFGALMVLALWALGLPHALLWGSLCGLLRYIPYVGALAAGAALAYFAAAIDPGWTLVLTCIGVYGILELSVAHLIEPKIYGNSTGVSPLAIVISALFWAAMWGPVGLLVSTPLTVCIVVAGRHVAALEPLNILFGQAPDVTSAQRFFQRALSGETTAILRDASAMLRRSGFARYCDQVLLPGLALAATEHRLGLIDAGQQEHLRGTVAEVAETLAPSGHHGKRRRHMPLLDANVGTHLRQLREARLGRWQGPLDVPDRSIVLCAGLAKERDELLSELLARSLREAGADARSVALPLPYEEHDPARASLVSTILVPAPLPPDSEEWKTAVSALRALLPQAIIVAVRLPWDEPLGPAANLGADLELRSFQECLAFATAPVIGKERNQSPS